MLRIKRQNTHSVHQICAISLSCVRLQTETQQTEMKSMTETKDYCHYQCNWEYISQWLMRMWKVKNYMFIMSSQLCFPKCLFYRIDTNKTQSFSDIGIKKTKQIFSFKSKYLVVLRSKWHKCIDYKKILLLFFSQLCNKPVILAAVWS